MIEKIQISDPNIAEEVRKQMAIATDKNKGLMPASQFAVFKQKVINVSPNGVNVINNVCGLVLFFNRYVNDANPTLYLCGKNEIIKISEGEDSLRLSMENYILTIKNLYSSPGPISVTYQFLQN